MHYKILVAEYEERWKIIELVTKSYWWSDITKDVKKYVNKCNIYHKIKNQTEVLVGNLMFQRNCRYI